MKAHKSFLWLKESLPALNIRVEDDREPDVGTIDAEKTGPDREGRPS